MAAACNRQEPASQPSTNYGDPNAEPPKTGVDSAPPAPVPAAPPATQPSNPSPIQPEPQNPNEAHRPGEEITRIYNEVRENMPRVAGPGAEAAINEYLYSNRGKFTAFIDKFEGTEEAIFAHVLRASAYVAGKQNAEASADLEYVVQTTMDATAGTRLNMRMQALELLAQLDPKQARPHLEVIANTNGESSARAKKALRTALAAEYLKIGHEMLPFQLMTIDGVALTPEALRGTTVLMYFWSSEVRESLDPIPELRKFYQKYKDQAFELVSISCDGDLVRSVPGYDEMMGLGVPAVRKFLKITKMPGVCVYDGKGEKSDIAQTFYVNSVPGAILFDKDGIIRVLGYDRDAITKNLEEIFGKK